MEEDYLEQLVMESASLSSKMREYIYVEMSHGVKVSNLAQEVAKELGEDETFCRQIAVAGLLHDIGKLWVMKHMNEAGSEETLTIERMKIVRMHPTHSCDMLMAEGYPAGITRAVYYHHENVDGTGYPENLRGDKIPWMARILRICDVYCALTTDRSYRRAFERFAAMEIMIDEVEDYDMRCFLAFQRVIHNEAGEKLRSLCTVISPLQKEHLPLFVKEAEAL